jgi:hypothetical protein
VIIYVADLLFESRVSRAGIIQDRFGKVLPKKASKEVKVCFLCSLIGFSILTLEISLQLGTLIIEDSIYNLVLDSTLLVSLAQPSELLGILKE